MHIIIAEKLFVHVAEQVHKRRVYLIRQVTGLQRTSLLDEGEARAFLVDGGSLLACSFKIG